MPKCPNHPSAVLNGNGVCPECHPSTVTARNKGWFIALNEQKGQGHRYDHQDSDSASGSRTNVPSKPTSTSPRLPGGTVNREKGYWRCPACGSDESFEGTAVAPGSSGNVSVVREVEGIPVILGQSTSGKPREVTVRKCKQCKEILGAKDYVKSIAELRADSKKSTGAGCVFVIGLMVILSGVLVALACS